jgi:hypothetical protein
MITLSEEAITGLIAERKRIPDGLQPITRMTERNKHLRREYEITCPATGNTFVVKLRRSTLNPFDFSVILGYQLPGVNTIFLLRRYNGKAHYHTNHLDENVRFRDFHIHTATERYQNSGDKVEHFAQVTARYADIDGAVECMLADCGFRAPMEESPIFTGNIIE